MGHNMNLGAARGRFAEAFPSAEGSTTMGCGLGGSEWAGAGARPLGRRGTTSLIELTIVLAVSVIIAGVAIPCLRGRMKQQDAAQTVAERLARHLRLARSLAILHASDNPQGFTLIFLGPGHSRYSSYGIQDESTGQLLPSVGEVSTTTASTVVTCDSRIRGVQFGFSGLGTCEILVSGGGQTSGNPALEVSGGGKLYEIHISAGSGHVELVDASGGGG